MERVGAGRIGEAVERLRELGIQAGDTLLVHSSLKALRCPGVSPHEVIVWLGNAVGPSGNLLLPALSYLQQPAHVHSTAETPSCVGVIAETFRRMRSVTRSVHPTHSVCGLGPDVGAWLDDHAEDNTPCGPRSPFRRILDSPAKILMLGCGLRPNTTMHALEEIAGVPYVLGETREYEITDATGRVYRKAYVTHDFRGWEQRYDRLAALADECGLRVGRLFGAECHLLDPRAMKAAVLDQLAREPLFFVDPK